MKYLQPIAWLVLLVGALLLMFAPAPWVRYLYCAGALACLVASMVLALLNKTEDVRLRRLYGLQFLASLLPAAGAWLLFENNSGWLVLLLAYALITLFLSFRFK